MSPFEGGCLVGRALQTVSTGGVCKNPFCKRLNKAKFTIKFRLKQFVIVQFYRVGR